VFDVDAPKKGGKVVSLKGETGEALTNKSRGGIRPGKEGRLAVPQKRRWRSFMLGGEKRGYFSVKLGGKARPWSTKEPREDRHDKYVNGNVHFVGIGKGEGSGEGNLERGTLGKKGCPGYGGRGKYSIKFQFKGKREGK